MYTAKILSFTKGLVSSNVPYEISKDGVVVESDILENLSPASSALAFIARRIEMMKLQDSLDESTLIGDIDLTAAEVKTRDQVLFESGGKLAQLEQYVKFGLATQADLDKAKADAQDTLASTPSIIP